MAFLGQETQIREFQDRFKYLYAILFLGPWTACFPASVSCRSLKATKCAHILKKTESRVSK